MTVPLTDTCELAWKQFLDNEDNHGHSLRKITRGSLQSHVAAVMESGEDVARRLKTEIGVKQPRVILEVGCSTGSNCIAMQKLYPSAYVFGLEPEIQALRVAKHMVGMAPGNHPIFLEGKGEKIPLRSGSVDLILCHTVIEHVDDVNSVISEFARVLADNGVLHLEAPNYLWPYEPHLNLWTVPKLGKWFVAMTAILQGKGTQISFLKHLKFVTPFQIERQFGRNSLTWENRVETKLMGILAGESDIRLYKRSARMIKILNALGFAKHFIALLMRTGMYPSILYTARKNACV